MTDGASKNLTSGPIDLGRLGKPDSDAFRYIAKTLGARFAGDDADLLGRTDKEPPVEPVSIRPAQDPNPERVGGPSGDSRAANLFEKLPFSIIVVDKGGVAFVNRTARDLLGYTAPVLDAAGGLGVLLTGAATRRGAMAVTTATGDLFDARVQMTPIDWANRRAIAVTIEPFSNDGAQRVATGAAPAVSEDALTDLLSANPDPVAIVSRSGRVEAANDAYRTLGPESARLGLEARLEALALERLLSHVGSAFHAAPGTATPVSVDVQGEEMLVTIGVLKSAEFACLIFRPLRFLTADTAPGGALATPAPGAALPATGQSLMGSAPVDKAVEKARRLVRDAAVLIVLEGSAAGSMEHALAHETERFFRAVLVSLGARAPAGTVVCVARKDGRYQIAISPHADGVLEEVTSSSRLVLYGLEAGLAIGELTDNRLDIAPIRQNDRASLSGS